MSSDDLTPELLARSTGGLTFHECSDHLLAALDALEARDARIAELEVRQMPQGVGISGDGEWFCVHSETHGDCPSCHMRNHIAELEAEVKRYRRIGGAVSETLAEQLLEARRLAERCRASLRRQAPNLSGAVVEPFPWESAQRGDGHHASADGEPSTGTDEREDDT